MDLRILTYFVTVAEELNITHAAEKLHISQPPLSAQIKKLEEELDTTLFIRGKRHLTLTDSGKLLYRRAKEILSLSDKAADEILSMGKGISGSISIGIVDGAAPGIAAPWISAFYAANPNISFRIVNGNSEDLIHQLRSGLINMAVITNPVDHTLLHSFQVGEKEICAYISKDHPLAKRPGDSIELRDLIGESLILPSRSTLLDLVYKWFKEVNATPRVVCQMNSYLNVVSLAEAKMGISLFPDISPTVNPAVVTKRIADSPRYFQYMLVWLKGVPLPQRDEVFIDFIREFSQPS